MYKAMVESRHVRGGNEPFSPTSPTTLSFITDSLQPKSTLVPFLCSPAGMGVWGAESELPERGPPIV